MEMDKKGKVDPLSSGLEAMEKISEIGGTELQIPRNFGYPNEVDAKNSLAINYGLGDHKKVEELVQKYHQDEEFMKVANALLGEGKVKEILAYNQ